MSNINRKDFEQYLNDTIEFDWESDEWIIGGKNRRNPYYPDRWGTALRRHDPIGFNVQFNDYARNYKQ